MCVLEGCVSVTEGVHRVQKRVLGPLGCELQGVRSSLVWVLGSEFGVSAVSCVPLPMAHHSTPNPAFF